MNQPKNIRGIAIGVLIITLVVFAYRYMKRDGDAEVSRTSRAVAGASGFSSVWRKLPVSAARETQPIPLIDGNGRLYRIVYGIVPDDVPYMFRMRQGPFMEPLVEYVPARSNRPEGWHSTIGEGRTHSATFQLPPGYADTFILYRVYPKER